MGFSAILIFVLTIPETVISPVVESGSKSVRMVVSSAAVRFFLEQGACLIHHLLLYVPRRSQVYARPYISRLTKKRRIKNPHIKIGADAIFMES